MVNNNSKKIKKEEKKIAFIISPIGEKKSKTRKRSDQILKYIIKPIVTELGYEAIRADDIDKPGIITTQIVSHIMDDSLVIADLTDQNPNVMYELALRHVIKKPVVQLIDENQLLPFDVSGNRTIKMDHTDLDSVNDAKEKLRKQIREVIKNPDLVDSPISQAITLSDLERTGNPFTKTLSNISSSIAEMLNRLWKIEQKIGKDNFSQSTPSTKINFVSGFGPGFGPGFERSYDRNLSKKERDVMMDEWTKKLITNQKSKKSKSDGEIS